MVARVLIDHVRIRRLAAEVAGDTPAVELLREFGGKLERHGRREERELFPLIEHALPEKEPRHLAALLAG